MTTRATSIPKNPFRLHQQPPEEEERPAPKDPPCLVSPQTSQGYPGAVEAYSSAFYGAPKSPPGPHRGAVHHNQSP